MGLIDSIHGNYVHKRRVRCLRDMLIRLLPENTHILDIGCGDGLLDALVLEQRKDLKIEGIDVLVRDGTHVPVTGFDGTTIPFPQEAFDAAVFVDVLHHTEDPLILLKEARRIVRRAIIIKDHLRENELDNRILSFMDRVGNARYGVALPHNYLSRRQWEDAFRRSGFKIQSWETRVPLYPAPLSWIFGRKLHFVALLTPVRAIDD